MNAVTRRRRTLVGVASTLAVLLGLAAFGALTYARAGGDKATTPMYADYLTYESLTALVDNAPLIVRGTVSGIAPATRVIPTSVTVDQLPPHKATNIGYLTTDVTITVEQVLAGASDLVGTNIVVIHLGGETATQQSLAEGQPLSQRGRQYVFFLRPAPDGRYIIVDGPQGRYTVQNGKLAVVDAAVKQLPVARQLDGLDLPTVADRIKGAKGGKP